jgi:parvulin-like peptidyl-prolyl isomerase
MEYGEDDMARIIAISAWLFWFGLFTGTAGIGAADSPLATVNGTAITASEVDAEMQRDRQRRLAAGQKPAGRDSGDSRQEVLERLVERELLYQAARKSGVAVTPAEIDDQYDQLAARHTGPGGVEAVLKRNRTTPEAVKSEIRRALMIARFLDREVARQAAVSPAEVRAYYDANPAEFAVPEQIRAGHIMLENHFDMSVQEHNRNLLASIRQRVMVGEAFGMLAQQYSQDTTGKTGGDLGYISRGRMPPAFDEAAFGLEIGTVSDIVQTDLGLHLIMVWDRKPATKLPFGNVEKHLTQKLQAERYGLVMDQLLEALKRRATIVYPPSDP